MTDDREGSGAPPVPPDQAPGEPSETVADEPGREISESEAEAEEDRVDAAPREIT